MAEIKLVDWTELINRFQGEMKDLCESCYDYTRLRNQIECKGSELEISDVAKLKKLGLEIREKYLDIMAYGGEAVRKKFEDRLNTTLSGFYEVRSGETKLINLFPELIDAKQKGDLFGYVSELFSQFDGLVEYIYYLIKEQLSKSDKIFPKLFADAVLKKIERDKGELHKS